MYELRSGLLLGSDLMQMDRIWPSDWTRRIKTSATLRARFVVVTRPVVRNSRSSHRMVVRVPSDAWAVAKTRGADGNAFPKNRRPGLESPWKTGGNQPEDHRRGQSCEVCIGRCGAARGLRPRTPIRWVSAGLARVDGPMARKGAWRRSDGAATGRTMATAGRLGPPLASWQS